MPAVSRQALRAALCAGSLLVSAASPQIEWQFAGPGGYYNSADPEPRLSSASATQAVVAQADGSWLVGTVNGGVWRSEDISGSPRWEPVTDNQPVRCQSISALGVPSGASAQRGVAYAGCGGSTSSEMGADWNVVNSGDWAGVMMTEDFGKSWSMTSFPPNYYVTQILALAKGVLVVSARSHLFDKGRGGIWRSDAPGDDGARREWTQVSTIPTFNLHMLPEQNLLLAGYAYAQASVGVSADGGKSWADRDAGIAWEPGHRPFYASFAAAHGRVYYGALTVNLKDSTKTNSKVWMAPVASAGSDAADTVWTEVSGAGSGAPANLDGDAMPKDRMALLADPEHPDVLYVAGNGDSIAYRVNVSASGGSWAVMTQDTTDGSTPHCDCRNFAWDHARGRLLLVSDGGIFARSSPATAGAGVWSSLNGDIGAMEFLSAHWDPYLERWVAGAQDNDVQVSVPDSVAHPSAVATGFVLGDGTVTAIDSSQSPARLFGCRQFFGSAARVSDTETVGAEDAIPLGLCYAEGYPEKVVCIDLAPFGFGPENFPYFVHPFALNKARPTDLVFWASQTANKSRGWWSLSIPRGIASAAELAPPKLLAPSAGGVLSFVSGGVSPSGTPLPNLMVAINATHLIASKDITKGVTESALPVTFAEPLTLGYDAEGQLILGPVSHGNTVTLAVSPADGAMAAVSGRPSVRDNAGVESVWLTRDMGGSWVNATGDLAEQVGSVGQPRPSALLLLPAGAGTRTAGCTAMLVGTVSGVFVSSTKSLGHWVRLGDWAGFPRVLVMGLSHEPISDTLVAATMGRGVYVAHNATKALEHVACKQG